MLKLYITTTHAFDTKKNRSAQFFSKFIYLKKILIKINLL